MRMLLLYLNHSESTTALSLSLLRKTIASLHEFGHDLAFRLKVELNYSQRPNDSKSWSIILPIAI
jgi:hypothetical protein